MQFLNTDIVLELCARMDLGTLSSFAVAYPEWESLTHRTIQKKSWGVIASVRRGRAILEYCSLDNSKEPVISHLKCCGKKADNESHSEDGSNANTSAFTLKEKIKRALSVKRDTDFREVAELPKFAWKHVPFHLMKISTVKVGVLHNEPTELFSEVIEVLAKITTDRLFLACNFQQEARKVLQAITFRPGSIVSLFLNSWLQSMGPLLEKCDFSNVDDFRWATGRMMAEDLSFLFKSSIKSLYLATPNLEKEGASLIQEYIKEFVSGSTPQALFDIDCRGRYVTEWFEELVQGRELGPENDKHQVSITCSMHGALLHSTVLAKSFICRYMM